MPDDIELPGDEALDLKKEFGPKWAKMDRLVQSAAMETLQAYGEKKREMLSKCAKSFTALSAEDQDAILAVLAGGEAPVTRGAILSLLHIPPEALHHILSMRDRTNLLKVLKEVYGEVDPKEVGEDEGKGIIAIFFLCVAVYSDEKAMKILADNPRLIREIDALARQKGIDPAKLPEMRERDIPLDIRNRMRKIQQMDLSTFTLRSTSPEMGKLVEAMDKNKDCDIVVQKSTVRMTHDLLQTFTLVGMLTPKQIFRTRGGAPSSTTEKK